MEIIISISRLEKSQNLSEGHGKSWKSNICFLRIKRKKDEEVHLTDKSDYTISEST